MTEILVEYSSKLSKYYLKKYAIFAIKITAETRHPLYNL